MDFSISEVVDEDNTLPENEREEIDEIATVSDNEFIDDTEEFDESRVADYYAFDNVTRGYDGAVNDTLSDFDYDQELNNYCDDDEVDLPIDEFKDYKKKKESFKETLVNPQGENNPNSFFYSILYVIGFQLTKKFDSCDQDDKIKEDIRAEIFDESNQIKESLRLDLDILNFKNQCFQINRILNKNRLFLRVFELKEKFHA